MKLTSVGSVIARREWFLEDNKKVSITIGKPEKLPDSDDFYCPFQILGLRNEDIKYAVGVDSVQSVILALNNIGSLLVSSAEYKASRLRWADGSVINDIGFPVPELIKDLIRPNSKS